MALDHGRDGRTALTQPLAPKLTIIVACSDDMKDIIDCREILLSNPNIKGGGKWNYAMGALK